MDDSLKGVLLVGSMLLTVGFALARRRAGLSGGLLSNAGPDVRSWPGAHSARSRGRLTLAVGFGLVCIGFLVRIVWPEQVRKAVTAAARVERLVSCLKSSASSLIGVGDSGEPSQPSSSVRVIGASIRLNSAESGLRIVWHTP